MVIKKLLSPKSVAVIGASNRPGSFGYFSSVNVQRSYVRSYFVNPNKTELLGEKVYPTVKDLPEVPDCVVIVTPRQIAVQNLKEAGEIGIGAAVIYASGFGEEHTPEAQALEKAIMEIAKQYDMAVLGPNCSGYLNNIDKVSAWGMMGTDFDFETRKTGVAMICQSGGVGIYFMSKEYIDISYVISCGNGNVTSIDEYIDYCVDDDNVKVILVYMEGIKKPDVLVEALKKAIQKKKPIVVLKSGRSKKGAASAASHTGSMAGSARAYEAVFERYGVILVDSFEEMVATAQALSVLHDKLPAVNGFAMLNGSGGENTVAADLMEKNGVNVPEFSELTKNKIASHLPSYGNPMNPLDFTASNADDETQISILNIMSEDPFIGGILIGSQANLEEMNERMIKQAEITGRDPYELQTTALLKYLRQENSLPVFLVPPYEDRRNLKIRKKMEEAGAAMMSCSELGFKEVANIGRFSAYDSKAHTLEVAIPDENHISDITIARSEIESKNIVRTYGIAVPKQMNCERESDLENIMKNLSYPVVMKVNSPDILHKSDIGGVKLHINNLDEAKTAFDDILSNCKAKKPEAEIKGILVEEMAQAGTEMIVGVSNDSTFGPMILVGIGGVSVEVYKDTALSPCPINHIEAVNMITSLKGYRLLSGFRGTAACDIDALADLMVKVSNFALECKDSLKELDLNPVIVYENGKGAIAVDAVVVEYKAD